MGATSDDRQEIVSLSELSRLANVTYGRALRALARGQIVADFQSQAGSFFRVSRLPKLKEQLSK